MKKTQKKVKNQSMHQNDKELAEIKSTTGKVPLVIENLEKHKFSIKSEYRGSSDTVSTILKKLTSTEDNKLALEIFNKGIGALPSTMSEEDKMNLILQTLADFEPKDATESKLLVQATSLFSQGMQYLKRSEGSDMMCHAEFYMKSAIKLLRLHNETIEAIHRYRRGGEQKMIIQHLNVNDGGKAAFVSNVKEG